MTDAPPQPMVPVAPIAPPMFGQGPQGKKPGQKSLTPSFLGSAMTPQAGQLGQKTLLGT